MFDTVCGDNVALEPHSCIPSALRQALRPGKLLRFTSLISEKHNLKWKEGEIPFSPLERRGHRSSCAVDEICFFSDRHFGSILLRCDHHLLSVTCAAIQTLSEGHTDGVVKDKAAPRGGGGEGPTGGRMDGEMDGWIVQNLPVREINRTVREILASAACANCNESSGALGYMALPSWTGPLVSMRKIASWRRCWGDICNCVSVFLMFPHLCINNTLLIIAREGGGGGAILSNRHLEINGRRELPPPSHPDKNDWRIFFLLFSLLSSPLLSSPLLSPPPPPPRPYALRYGTGTTMQGSSSPLSKPVIPYSTAQEAQKSSGSKASHA
ncbi:unnamed protein product [Pleuronectes platessa]|uniref:Uncharacterized protein n=1 Tax=Pleuronectes platessa TaxID=8262 RepID=A0A9N7UNF2_PLEPL|nr:unnamed protein product [Pleuronectes platessa]